MVHFDHTMQGREPERDGFSPYYKDQHKYTDNNPQRITQEEMESLTLADYGLEPQAVHQYMFGVEMIDPRTGEQMGDDFYNHTLETAVSQAEHKLDIAIFPRVRDEYHDYRNQEYNSFMMTHLYKRPIIQVEDAHLEYNGRAYFNFPPRTWKVYHLFGHVQVSPHYFGYARNHTNTPLIPMMNPYGAVGHTSLPQNIRIKYIAGLLPRKSAGYNEDWEMPADLEKYILKLAVKEIFQQWGRLIVQPGLASHSLTIDGVTESHTTTQSAMYTVIDGYVKQINADLADLEDSLGTYFGTNSITSV